MSRKRQKKESKGSCRQVDEKTEPVEKKEGDTGATDKPNNGTSINDPAWYAQDPQLLADAARIPFSLPFGSSTNIISSESVSGCIAKDGSSHTIKIPEVTSLHLPGIVSLRIKPSYGYQKDKNDPANVAASSFYTFVRYVNSGRKNYDPADLYIYTATIADLYSFVVWCQRLYSMAFMYSQANYFVGKRWIEVQHVDSNDLLQNLANFRYWINAFINKVSSYAIPASINLFKRRAFMYSSIYIENPYGNIKDQMYMFSPDGFYKFALDPVGKGMLEYTPLYDSANMLTVKNIMSFGESLLQPIWADEDFGLISGDIIKSYGSNLIGLSSQPDDAGILPIYDPYVLSQFKNANIVDVARTKQRSFYSQNYLKATIPNLDTSGDCMYKIDSKYYGLFGNVYQDLNGNIVCQEAILKNKATVGGHDAIEGDTINQYLWNYAYSYGRVVSLENPTPGVEDIIECSRLMVSIEKGHSIQKDKNSSDNSYLLVRSGTEIVVACDVMSDWETYSFSSNVLQSVNSGLPNVEPAIFCKYLPIMRNDKDYYNTDMGSMIKEDMTFASNFDNVTVFSNDNIRRLNEVAQLSLMYVQGIAKVNNM